jgi:HTH-type transcriptional regulator/antitoxin HigA
MLEIDLKTTASLWPKLSNTIFVPRTETEYNRLVATLDELIYVVGEDDAHPLASLMEIIGVMIEHYENANVPELV